jgi:transcriptional regulator with XRE-family HTH domain
MQERLRELRGPLSLAAFAEKVGKPGQGPQFGKYEAGKIPPNLDTLAAVAKAMGVPLSVFYVEEPTTAQPLTTQDVVRLRDQVRELRDTADGVLAALEGALNGGAPVRTPKRKTAPIAPGTARERLGKKRKRA